MRVVRRKVGESCVRLAVLSALLAVQPMSAWAEPTGARYQVDQPSQPLAEALKAIARQTNVSVLFDPGVVGTRRSHAVAGQFTGAEAISKALEGTGLTAEVMRDGSVVVKPNAAPGSRSSTESTDVVPAHADPIRLAQAPTPTQGTSDADTTKPIAERQTPQKLVIVEVTGTRIKRVETEGAFPLNVYKREDLDKSGQPTLVGFLNGLNEVSLSSTSAGGIASVGAVGISTVQLRGLPLGSTLVLVNGRRIQDSGLSGSSAFANLDAIPFAAVDRIEVLPVGSSAVYGGDALAGVVNIILKKSMDGVTVDTRYGHAKGTEDGGLSLVTGSSLERGSFLLVGSVTRQTPLHTSERDFFNDADYRRFGGTDERSQLCSPGTVSSTDGSNLPGLNSPVAGIPSVTGRPLTINDFVPTAGVPNLCAGITQGNGQSLIWSSRSAAIHATGEYRVAQNFTALAELTYTKSRQIGRDQGLALDNVFVPDTNPFNPFGVPVVVVARLGTENGTDGTWRRTTFSRALVGLRNTFDNGWELEATATSAADDNKERGFNQAVDFAALDAALASPTVSASLNPFTTGRAAEDNVLRGIWSDVPADSKGSRDLVSAFVRGSAFSLPAGPVDLIAGVEAGRDKWRSGDLFDTSRRSKALFAETRIPLLSSTPATGSRLEVATLSLAARNDRYSEIGSADTYQAGIELRPMRSVLLRGAAATSFKPPTLFQLNQVEVTLPFLGFFGLTDPRRGNAPITSGDLVLGAKSPLNPEKGEAATLGVLWEPDSVAGLRAGLNWWRIDVKDQIIRPRSPQFFLNNEALFPNAVVRDPPAGGVPGQVTALRWLYVNVGEISVEGADLDLGYSWRGGIGTWRFAAGGTRTSKYDLTPGPGSPTEDRLGRRSLDAWAPKWKARVAAGLDTRPWSLGVSGRYVGSYRDAGNSTRELGGDWLYDLNASVDLKRLISLGTKSATLTASVVNATNKLPEYVDGYPFFDATQGDWRGRYIALRLSVGL